MNNLRKRLWVVGICALVAACGGDDGDGGGGGTPDAMGGGGSIDAAPGGGGELSVPATATMGDADGQAGGLEHSGLCQRGFQTFALVDSGNTGICGFSPPGISYVPYVRFHKNGSAYSVVAGGILQSDGMATVQVDFASTTNGTLVDGAMDEVTDIPENTPTTIVSQDRTLTFSFSGTMVTVTDFSAL